MASIVPLSAVEPALVEQLLDEAFGPERHARTAYRIRTGMDWLEGLSFAALDDEDYLAGTIQMWPVALHDPEGRAHPMVMVGPVAVIPALQNGGYGKALMAASLGAIDTMARQGQPALPQVMIGDEPYYGRWGFTAQPTGGWRCPGPWDPARLLVRCENPAVLPAEGMLGPWTGPLAE
ncbi:MAG: N-acetyltransferase [Sphingomonadaceae bacterium]|nr:N-acetyltransferase [Sphingomonadaceae bacterium]